MHHPKSSLKWMRPLPLLLCREFDDIEAKLIVRRPVSGDVKARIFVSGDEILVLCLSFSVQCVRMVVEVAQGRGAGRGFIPGPGSADALIGRMLPLMLSHE